MTPTRAAQLFNDGKIVGLAKIQNEWDASEWTEFDIERQRLANTEWYQWAVKDGRIAA